MPMMAVAGERGVAAPEAGGELRARSDGEPKSVVSDVGRSTDGLVVR